MDRSIRVRKTFQAGMIFHITVHGVGDTNLFRNGQDMRELLARYRNYLSPRRFENKARKPYEKLGASVSLLSYCLLFNHFHLVLQQHAADGIERLMRRTQPAYARYFNDRYGRRGALYDSRYAATPMKDLDHAKMAIAYTHLNHIQHQLDYEFSSHALYMGERSCDWIDAPAGLAIFGGRDGYMKFLDKQGPGIIKRKLEKRDLDPASIPYRPIT